MITTWNERTKKWTIDGVRVTCCHLLGPYPFDRPCHFISPCSLRTHQRRSPGGERRSWAAGPLISQFFGEKKCLKLKKKSLIFIKFQSNAHQSIALWILDNFSFSHQTTGSSFRMLIRKKLIRRATPSIGNFVNSPPKPPKTCSDRVRAKRRWINHWQGYRLVFIWMQSNCANRKFFPLKIRKSH